MENFKHTPFVALPVGTIIQTDDGKFYKIKALIHHYCGGSSYRSWEYDPFTKKETRKNISVDLLSIARILPASIALQIIKL